LIGKEFWGRVRIDEDGTRLAKSSLPFLLSQVYPQTGISDWL
jgi:hypothetical protein